MTFMPVDEAIAQTEVSRFHTDSDGFIWYGDNDQPYVNSFLDAEEFLATQVASELLAHSRCIRLLGTKDNAALIVHLHLRRIRDHKESHCVWPRICLGSPAVIPTLALRQDPEMVLHSLWQPEYRSRCHGLWHDMTEKDYCTYAMIHHGCGDGPIPDVVKRLAVYHPAWTPLSFVSSLDYDNACRLLCEVVDPRWYRHFDRQHRSTKLYSHLGLTPRNIAAYMGEGEPDRNYNRATVAIKSWYNLAGAKQGPSAFLWRIFDSRGKNGTALLRTTQYFVRFLHTTWLMAVSPPHPEVKFNPAMFFQNGDEADAYVQHLAIPKFAGKRWLQQ